jgi:hypothetical protein
MCLILSTKKQYFFIFFHFFLLEIILDIFVLMRHIPDMATITLSPDKIGQMGLTGTIVYAGTYFCTCGAKVNYQDENGKPERLIKCWECVQNETK